MAGLGDDEAGRVGDSGRHLLDQGWAEGSILGTNHHFGYNAREYYLAKDQGGKLMQLYRQALKAVGNSDPERRKQLVVELAELSEGKDSTA